jgi:hypothetical protein
VIAIAAASVGKTQARAECPFPVADHHNMKEVHHLTWLLCHAFGTEPVHATFGWEIIHGRKLELTIVAAPESNL